MGLYLQSGRYGKMDLQIKFSMKNIGEFLKDAGLEGSLAEVFNTLASSVKRIAEAIAFADSGKAESMNSFGEEQLQLDLLAERIIEEEAKKNAKIGLIASEELEQEEKISDGEFGICYDPLDGSSLVDSNLAVGTIFGIYKTGTFIGVKGREQLGALIAVYGPRTSIVLTFLKGVHEFVLDSKGDFILSNEGMKVGEGKMFAPGNLRACVSEKWYLDLVNYWIKEQYTLRYSGGMVPDINQILIKGKGIFSYPGYDEAREGKLRLLFECAPMALLMEEAGGAGSDGNVSILDKVVESVQQRTPVFLGSIGEVERCKLNYGAAKI